MLSIMFCRFAAISVFSTLALGMNSGASAGVLWDESVNPDLSGDGLAPTFIGTLAHGSNQIFGSTGNPGTPDRDYFFISVPVGLHFASLRVLTGTTSGNLSFLGLQAGSQVTLPTNTQTAIGLLGWWHYSPADIDHDILPSMSIPNLVRNGVGTGNSGFDIPLGPGNYAFWVQDTSGGGPFNYRFDLTAVPEPGIIAMMLLGLAGLGWSRRRK